ncbi:MAG: DUF4199 domain-containing protein [Bacteroidota bacterium]|nr:DUF4199 domain-containing protein [Bacteroidota bacterium]
MKNYQSNMLPNAALFGLYWALASFILTLLYWVFDINLFSVGMSVFLGLINIGVMILFLWLSNKTLRDKYLDGVLTYGQGFLNLLVTGLVSMVVGGVLMYIFYKFIAPDYLPKMGEKIMAMLQSNPNVPMEAIEKTQAKFANMTPENSVIKSIPGSLGFIIAFSLIVSAFTKKKPDIFAAENTTEEEN